METTKRKVRIALQAIECAEEDIQNGREDEALMALQRAKAKARSAQQDIVDIGNTLVKEQ